MPQIDTIIYSGHALRRMFERRIKTAEVEAALKYWDVIEEYPDDTPYPSALLLGEVAFRPLHVVAAYNDTLKECIVVTAYEPDREKWTSDYRRRKEK
jgi:hypothetical protein